MNALTNIAVLLLVIAAAMAVIATFATITVEAWRDWRRNR